MTKREKFTEQDAYALLKAISRAQEHAISAGAPRQLFDDLLSDLLALTDSEYGNIGEVLRDPDDGKLFLRSHACTNIAWNDAMRALFQKAADTGMEFRELNSLYGAVMVTGDTVIANDPSHDSRRCGLPEGHPALNAYLGIPVYVGGKLAAMVGLANRPGGYDQFLVDFLQPLIKTYGRIIERDKAEQGRCQAEQSLKESHRYAELLASYITSISGLPQQVVADATLAFLADQLGIQYSTIALLDSRENRFLTYAICASGAMNIEAAGEYIPAPATLLSEVVKDKQPCYRPDIADELARCAMLQKMQTAGVRSMFCVPLWIEDRCLGTLNAGADQIDGFSEPARKFITLLASILAHALQNAELFKALRESEQYNRRLFENTAMGLALSKTDGGLVDANQAYAQLTGRSVEKVLQLSCYDITPEKYGEQERQRLASLQRTGRYGPYEKELVHQDGRLVPVRLNDMLLEKDGQSYILSSVEDITQYRQAQKELTQFRAALDHTYDNVLLIDPDTMLFVDCNRSALTHMGYSREELLAIGPMDIMPELSEETVRGVVDKLLTGQEEFIEYGTVHQRKDGSLFPVEVRLSPVSSVTDRRLLIAMVRDVSERKVTEEKLRLLAAVFESTAEGVMVTDKNSNIVVVNRAFTETTGYAEQEVLGKNPRILKSGRHDRSFFNALWSSLNNAGAWQGELWDRRKNGEVFPTWSTISAVYDDKSQLTHYVSVFSDISSIKRSQEQLDFLAHHDPLTRLPNRVLLNDRLDHALHRAQRDGHHVAVLFLDMDRFKNINDSLGHPIGDELLQVAAQRIRNSLREEDTLARLGGDEFIVLLEEVQDLQQAAVTARKLIDGFYQPFTIKGNELHVTLSIGISFYPQDGADSATLVKNADAAMYRAKEEGRNDFRFYTAAFTSAVFERLTLETALRRALEREQLLLYYQPQYCLKTGRLTGAEALLRWQHPDMGLVSPDKFIPLAEESGLIVPIGEWVLRTACMQLKHWRDAGLGLERIAVNVSGIQFQRGSIVDSVRAALQEAGLSGKHLELEITESFIMQKEAWAIEVLNDIKRTGVTITIDDFGTGYSSLSYLKRLPIDKLKIDSSFVRDIPRDPNDEAITRAVLALGHSLQLEVIAEGVETEEQQTFLKSLGCNEVQGFLYSRPVSGEAFEQLLKNIKS